MTGPRSRPLRVLVLVSATGANLRTLLAMQDEDPTVLQVVLVASDLAACPALEVAAAAGIESWPGTFATDVGSRIACVSPADVEAYTARARSYHDRLAVRVRDFEASNGAIDLVVLAYHRWIDGDLLHDFRGRMINQHPGDLRILDHGERALVGRDPVHLALTLGHDSTRTSTFFVDESRDGGAVIAVGPPVHYAGSRPVTRASADEHELRQKQESDPVALRWSVRAFAEGRLAVHAADTHDDGSPVVTIDGRATALGGMVLDAPAGSEVVSA